jgi:hypothetical protein
MNFVMNTLFANKFEVDEREPQFFFTVPNVGTFGLVSFDPMFWVQSFALLMLQSVINILAAIVIYTFIVKQSGSTSAYLIGYGIVCPLLVYIPFRIIEVLDLRNIAFMMCASLAMPSLLFFRCLEAMHQTLPSFAKQSLGQFILYYASSLQFNFDPKTEMPVPLTRKQVQARVGSFASLFLQTALLYSLLIPNKYVLFPRREIRSLTDLFYWGNLLNSYLMAYLTGIALESGATGLGLMTSLISGMSTMEINHSPLTRSTSPSDFWGQRWDRIISSGLRRGVFRPVRQWGFSRPFAVLATFCASGILHEYVLVIMAIRGHRHNTEDGDDEPYAPAFGKQFCFFAWNAVVILLEHAVKGHSSIQWMQDNFPAPVRTALVLLTVLPIAFLFTDEYVACGFYSDISMGFPKVVFLGDEIESL